MKGSFSHSKPLDKTNFGMGSQKTSEHMADAPVLFTIQPGGHATRISLEEKNKL